MGLASGRWAAWAVGGAAAVGGFALVMVVASCLPDLTAATVTPGDADAPPPPPPTGCGDGFIDLEAGEECDPGDAGAQGCTSQCKVSCGTSFVDPLTRHCYFVPQDEAGTFTQAGGRCAGQKAHPVTFVSEEEFIAVTGSSLPPAFWVGLQSAQPSVYVASNPTEPGWAPFTECSGCYAHLKNADLDTTLPRINADGGGGCVVGVRGSGTWYSANCTNPERIVCEREPPGSRARQVNDGWDIDVPATFGLKHYFFSPLQTPAWIAEQSCRQWNDAGTGRLVVFGSREEREQLLKEVIEVSGQSDIQFWIGLYWLTPVDAGADAAPGGSWVWDDGQPLDPTVGHPLPWGDKAPETNGPGRAFVHASADSYDTQLAHALPAGGLGYVCQY